MTTAKDATRLKECYRFALATGQVARFRETFRRGQIVRFLIDEDEGFSDGVKPDETTKLREILIGQFQLRHSDAPERLAHYGVWGRTEGTEDSWVPVDGPWRCGDGPFDNPPRKPVWAP